MKDEIDTFDNLLKHKYNIKTNSRFYQLLFEMPAIFLVAIFTCL